MLTEEAQNSRDLINSSPLGKNGRHFTDDLFRCIFLNTQFCIFKISLKFVPKDQTDKPLFEPMLTQFIYAEGGGEEMSMHDVQLVVIL